MNSAELFRAYRRMIATPDDGTVNWWYSGWSFAEVDDQPDIPLMQVMAIMTYRSETLSPESFRIHWSEIGVFKDPATGELPSRWVNPLTGLSIKLPRGFREGPGSSTITQTMDGLHIDIVQPHATVHRVDVRFQQIAGRLGFTQTERKFRESPSVDGKWPPSEMQSGFEGITQLSFFSSLEDLAKPSEEELAVQATYSFRLFGLSPYLGFGALSGSTVTRGRITRAPLGQPLDATAWGRLQSLFPEESASPPAVRR